VRAEYDDILSLIPKPPEWWDENGVPRYCAFHPHECADIYADEAVLVLIRCQSCSREFHVAMTHLAIREKEVGEPSFRECIPKRDVEYGDPPNVGCCLSGPSMMSVTECVLECWERVLSPDGTKWVRLPEFEVNVDG
jgi:hypothetical protein